MKKLVIARRASQTFFALLCVYVLWSTTYPLTGAIHAGIFFKADPLIMLVTAFSERVVLPGIALAAAMLVLAAVFGRFFCGWICPLGACIDLAGAVPVRRLRTDDRRAAAMARVKFPLLAAIIIAAAFGVEIAWALDPIGIVSRFISLNFIPAATVVFERLFIFLIRDLGLGGAVQDFYRWLRPTVLGVRPHFFPTSLFIFLLFLAVVALSGLVTRFWCRAVCPLGALYAIVSRVSVFRRTFEGCRACGICKSECRMGAIRDDLTDAPGECILCMDCVYSCPQHVTRWRWGLRRWGLTPTRLSVPMGSDPGTAGTNPATRAGISRRQFLSLAALSLPALGFRFRRRHAASGSAGLIRPPGALREEEFVDRCVRCGNCMKVCITNGLQPAILESGLRGVWTPHLVPEIGYCEHQCTLCGQTCPTGAIAPLSVERKKRTRLGRAVIDRKTCIPWAEGRPCIVCEEHCPIPEKAIKLMPVAGADGTPIVRPYVDPELCVGCAICQNKCPVRPVRAIRVIP